jgi:hypothetical protein
VFQKLKLVDDAIDGVGIRRPFEWLRDEPRVAAFRESDVAIFSGNFERTNIRGLRAEHAPARFLPVVLRAPAPFEAKDEEEQRDVEEEQNERDFGAHGDGILKLRVQS